jgi:dihydroorotate dehydrogenase (NAD+) catalytic subunit
VRVPIIGLGGIDTGEDVLEYFLVGASAIQVGTASFAEPNSCGRIISELEKLCASWNISRISELRGTFQAEKH